jgi:hypothetical protein
MPSYAREPQRYSIDAGGGRSGRGILALTDDGYPPLNDWAPTGAQLQDTMNACAASAASGRPEPLAIPYEYGGPNLGPLHTGDMIDEIYSWDGECLAGPSYRRRCSTMPNDPHCAGRGLPAWVWWLGGLTVVAGGAYLATR